MLLVISILGLFVNVDVVTRTSSLFVICLYTIIGGIVYLVLSYKFGVVKDVFGDKLTNQIKKIVGR